MLAVSVAVCACGPFYNMTSNPLKFHFYQGDSDPELVDRQKQENIRLWQSLTSDTISVADIDAAVYKSTYTGLQELLNDANCRNGFVKWLNAHNSSEMKDFLLLAKEVEEMRAHRVSPWYYPSDKSGFDKSKNEKEKFDSILAACQSHRRGKLADRYSLQAIRVLLSMGEYQRCIDYYGSTLKSCPDNNLFKQMAKGYIGGCLYRLGEKEKAYRLFAEAGDFNSILWEDVDGDEYMKIIARSNPESDVFKSRLNGFVGYGDDKANRKYIAIANAALSSPYVTHRGDWLYLKAYIEAVYNNNTASALSCIRQANASKFSTQQMADDARFFEICIRAQRGDVSTWLADSKWILESYGNKDGILFYIIPALLKKGMTNEALLLANYGTDCDINGKREDGDCVAIYANAGFQLLLSVKPSDVIRYKNMLNSSHSGAMADLIAQARKDDDYLNEIIGTLYLREGKYDKAEEYLSNVSERYQESMNIYPYLTRDPWIYCYQPKDKWFYRSYKPRYYFEEEGYDADYLLPKYGAYPRKRMPSANNAKYKFAVGMSELEDVMKNGKTADERSMARLKYAIGRYNSFNSCWALTQYWAGSTSQCDYRPFYWLWNGDIRELDYLVDAPLQLKGIDEKFENELISIFDSLQSDEALAQANMMLYNYLTIARHYPGTAAGRYLATHCDAWKDWL